MVKEEEAEEVEEEMPSAEMTEQVVEEPEIIATIVEAEVETEAMEEEKPKEVTIDSLLVGSG